MRTKLGLLTAASLVVVAALVSGSIMVYFLAWLVAVTVAGAHLLARRGLGSWRQAPGWIDGMPPSATSWR